METYPESPKVLKPDEIEAERQKPVDAADGGNEEEIAQHRVLPDRGPPGPLMVFVFRTARVSRAS